MTLYVRDTNMSEKRIARLRELAQAVTYGREAINREFTMRVPADEDRDADCVLSWAADALEQATRWNSIESAPKDGTEILGWREDCGHLLIRWDCAESFLTESEIEAGGWNDDNLFAEDWFCADFIHGSRLDGSEAPTHWMSLPRFTRSPTDD